MNGLIERFSWAADMYVSVVEVAEHKETFTTDDIFEYFNKTYGQWYGVDNRSIGPVIKKALKNGLMRLNTEEGYRVSSRPQMKGSIVVVYKSLIYKTPLWKQFKAWFNRTF